MKQGLTLAVGGVVLGVIAAVVMTRWLTSLLFGVTATDPMTFVFIAVLPLLLAAAACWIPARRATKVDPLVALKYE